MAYEVKWSPEAVEDVEAIAAWIGRDSPQHAEALVDRLLQVVAALDHNPFRGRVVPEFEDSSYRETFVFSYRVIYRVDPAAVVVIAIVHGKRLLENIPRRE
ncbi:type II toxin-antitoxin system RelE/ParE family toxin [Aquisalimonas sp. 2447]|uniref:type II toxin-antitoxin system RelE/ParE family toxin n=1 Tax=Aquisalimonas sp. 2447 TaxID=2740807 RepID=UPI0014326D27|nr:type II toxin-antitoxin system RelE/ParE family toxin [Aquisalimonas sp. 2447]QIT54876.1 type II toxin-antitoxin system RelE/ParE family toxin [Aquisalimonas sp. 2447]